MKIFSDILVVIVLINLYMYNVCVNMTLTNGGANRMEVKKPWKL